MEVLIERHNGSEKEKNKSVSGRCKVDFFPIDKDVGSDPASLLALLGFPPPTREEIEEIEKLFHKDKGGHRSPARPGVSGTISSAKAK